MEQCYVNEFAVSHTQSRTVEKKEKKKKRVICTDFEVIWCVRHLVCEVLNYK